MELVAGTAGITAATVGAPQQEVPPQMGTMPEGWRPQDGGCIGPITPPSPLDNGPLPADVPNLQARLIRDVESISRLDLTIHAMCQRRASLHGQLVVSQLCLYEIVASRRQAGPIVMHGKVVSPAGNALHYQAVEQKVISHGEKELAPLLNK